MSLLSRFRENQRVLISELLKQKLVIGNRDIAESIADKGIIVEFLKGETIINQDESEQDVYFILTGEAEILINGTRLPHKRIAGESVGEMSAIDPTSPRAATIIANCSLVALKLDAESFNEISEIYPNFAIATTIELTHRLTQRNALIDKSNMTPRLFIISTAEALKVANNIKLELKHEKVDVTIWSKPGTFTASCYPLESLEDAFRTSDFGLAIMSGDDIVISRGEEFSATRDNVIFELGLFMGFLGRRRTFIAVPTGEDLKLASDLQGLTPLNYIVRENYLDTGNLVTELLTIMDDQGVK